MPYIYEVDNPEMKIAEMKEKASGSGLTVTGNNFQGSITGMGLKGNYKVEGKTITIEIPEKPFFISESMIQSSLDKFLG